MNYYLDFEFNEGFYKPFLGKNRHFIDLISIGIVAEDGREYYAISKDFDIKATWNSFQMEQVSGDGRNIFPEGVKKYWLRENVLKPIHSQLVEQYLTTGWAINEFWEGKNKFTYGNFKWLLNKFGKSNKQISEEIIKFVSMDYIDGYGEEFTAEIKCDNHYIKSNPEFYGYYADYDWVLFCSLFGRMIDLPTGFPMYCIDLKQMLDEKINRVSFDYYGKPLKGCEANVNLEGKLRLTKARVDYPKQENEHNALQDAIFNRNLYDFLKTI